ncbi:MAG TPA: hypothetical protein ENK87_03390 [Nitratifractor sp.]|nr:hypothetical protein [Nitratifractor sp.]
MKLLLKGAITTALLSTMLLSANSGLHTETRTVNYITDTNGKSLYTFDKDSVNKSNCNAGCLKKWPRVVGEDGAFVSFNKHPLYYFFKDSKAGDTKGDNVKSVWHLVYPGATYKADANLKLSKATMKQRYLTDSQGMALYAFDKDSKNLSNCKDECLKKWPSFYADLHSVPKGLTKSDFGTIIRADGKRQTTYKGKPLYYFFKDIKVHDTKGDWVKGVWHLIEVKGK